MFLSFIPIIGPILEGLLTPISTMVGKFFDSKIAKTQADATVDSAAIAQGVAADKNDRIAIRLAQDILVFPWAVYGGLTGWDYVMAYHYPNLVWTTKVVPVESGLAYLPYMVFVYLLGATGLVLWKRK